jgi:hypothetical protein
LRSRLLGDEGDKQARSPGRARSKPLKPSRAGMPGDPGATVVTNARATYSTRAAAGASGTRHSPRPPFRGGRFWQQLGHIMPRERGRILRRHHPRKRMIQYSATSVMGSRVAAYWIPAFAGMTACCGASQCFAEPCHRVLWRRDPAAGTTIWGSGLSLCKSRCFCCAKAEAKR